MRIVKIGAQLAQYSGYEDAIANAQIHSASHKGTHAR